MPIIDYNTQLINSAWGGNYEEALEALNNGADPNASRIDGATALQLACYKRQGPIARLLVEKGANVRVANIHGTTPLHMTKDPATAVALIHAGAEIDAKDFQGNTPLMLACIKRATEVARVLLENQANVNIENDRRKSPSLFLEESDHSELKELFHQYCINPSSPTVNSTKNSNMATFLDIGPPTYPLHDACSTTAHIEPLIGNGQLVNVQDDNGDTPLHRAARVLNTQAIVILFQNGALGNLQNNKGETPLHCILGSKHRPAEEIAPAVSLLLKYRVNVNFADSKKQTPLSMACSFGSGKIVEQLINAGAEINVRNVGKQSPLDIANLWGYPEIASLLKARGADENTLNSSQESI